ncbi:M16 family metallopeptidase [Campylobacter hyointestinalis]|uniref:M16 family metallopeptidase n=1 Tax=Campylobacter hyointestinalis TaxID=198 RepID=UPI002555F4FB|nr:pitrilysin family protein [Campylobacter hyointestinalis]MDL2347046.1 pitrilysin family protein [Campylobacter hyointestinalis]MDL2348340.1 pitrilysin family protein [Campylobacter hyointestinalis]MDL2350533.1 pitrilysin family protein [Campylobacter hyointestinalis]MDM1025918.1 pitrilysin family protein [Campylobacter hyointestinalis]MDM1027094.1 pitrilysin family protein [Campylobacter hyointestinalis]
MEKLELNIKNICVPVIYEYDNTLPLVSFKLVFKVAGSIQNKKPGLASMCAELLGEGTKKLGVNEFNKRLDERAVYLNISAGFETFVIEIDCLKEHFEFALDSLKELLEDPNYTEETLEKLKAQTLGTIAANASDFDYQAKIELNKILFEGSNLADPSIGTKSSVELINLEDIRDFISSNLDISNLFLVLGGDVRFDLAHFINLLEPLNLGKKRELEKITTNSAKQKKIIKKNSEQAYVYFGAPFNVPSQQKFMANVAIFILGSSGFGSRFMEEIRVKRGLAYSVYIMNFLNLSNTSVMGYLQTKNESKDEAVKVVLSELEKFVKFGVTSKELDAAKSFLLGSEPLSKETLFKRLDIAQNDYYMGYELGEFDKNLEKIKNLELKTLNDFILSHKEILDQSFAIITNEI